MSKPARSTTEQWISYHVWMSQVHIEHWKISASDIFVRKARLTVWFAGARDRLARNSFLLNTCVKELFSKGGKLVKLLPLKGNLVWLWGGTCPGAGGDHFWATLLCPHQMILEISKVLGSRSELGLVVINLPKEAPNAMTTSTVLVSGHLVSCLACSVNVSHPVEVYGWFSERKKTISFGSWEGKW